MNLRFAAICVSRPMLESQDQRRQRRIAVNWRQISARPVWNCIIRSFSWYRRLHSRETPDMSQTARILRKWWLTVPGVLLLLLLLAVGFLIFRSRGIEERTRQWVVQTLSQRFQSDVDLDAIHIKVFPQLSVAGDGLTLHHHGRRDVPPLIHIKRFTFTAGVWELLHPIKH